MTDQLIPRQPRRLRQPTKAVLREHLAIAASELERTHAEIERLRFENKQLRQPWLKRLLRKSA